MADKYFYAAGGGGNWQTPRGNPAQYNSWYNGPGGTGGLVNMPTTGDTAIFNAASGGGTCTVYQNVSCSNIITTGFTGNIIGNGVSINVTGSYITLGEGGVFSASRFPSFTIVTTGTVTLTSGGQTVGDIILSSGTLTLADDLTGFANSYLKVFGGTFNANNKNVAMGTLSDEFSGISKTIIFGTGKWTLGAAGPIDNPATVWSVSNSGNTTTLNTTGAQPIRLLRYNSISRLRSTGGIDNSTQSINIYGAVGQNFTTNTWPTSGTVLIDNEQITYTGYTATSTSDVTLTGCFRGANATTAASHSKYAPVFLISPPGYTKLTADLSAAETTVANVTSNTDFGTPGNVLIDAEILTYATKNSSTTLDTLTRGSPYGSTGAVFHANGSIVRSVETRIFYNASGMSTLPQIECWSNGNYHFTDFQGNGSSTAGGFTNVSFNNLGPQRVSYSTNYLDAANGTYYSYMNGGDEDFFSFF